MINNIIPRIKKIFVGRHSELQQLEALWNFSCQDEEHLVYVFLNAPGVGKTTLIKYFGDYIEKKGIGLFIRFVCSSGYDSPVKLNRDLLFKIQDIIRDKQEVINNFLLSIENSNKTQALQKNLKLINDEIEKILNQKLVSLNDIIFILKRLSSVIPLFFAADEIQEFQKLVFIHSVNTEKEKETALHYFTRILKDLMNSRILLVLSGTRYHILSQIGGEIGSPIRQKVRPITIKNFEQEEVNAYVEQVKKIVEKVKLKAGKETVPIYLENYRQILFAFSGGHPRTIENITEIFLNNLPLLITNSHYLDYNMFMDFLLPKTEEFFDNSLLTSVHKEALSNLATSEGFSDVKKWILNKGSHGQYLGERPKLSNNSRLDEEIKRIVYELMNIGIIVQNGSYYYHLTSYFYFVEFLKVYREPYEEFLKQILHNKYFKLMCGRHSGFGYTFENILTAALIIYGIKEQENIIPIQSTKLRSLKVINGKIKVSELTLEPNILYQTPDAETIDAIVIQEEKLLLVQVTAANPPNPLKLDALRAEINVLSEINLKNRKFRRVRGWLVSLYDFKKELSSNEKILITAGIQLIPLIGEELYNKLKEVKQSFSK